MNSIYSRTEKLIGSQAVAKLKKAKVIVFGLGGVGSYAVEALARSGIGKIEVVDNDCINITNINRQLIALHSTIGKQKTQVAVQRIKDINPEIDVDAYNIFYDKDSCQEIDLSSYDYVVDAIDTVTSKILLIDNAKRVKVPIISSMGTGNKLNPSMFQIDNISKTSVCPLARVIRTELKKRGITELKVLFSKEQPVVKERTPASISFVPSVAGLLIASELIKDIINYDI